MCVKIGKIRQNHDNGSESSNLWPSLGLRLRNCIKHWACQRFACKAWSQGFEANFQILIGGEDKSGKKSLFVVSAITHVVLGVYWCKHDAGLSLSFISVHQQRRTRVHGSKLEALKSDKMHHLRLLSGLVLAQQPLKVLLLCISDYLVVRAK